MARMRGERRGPDTEQRSRLAQDSARLIVEHGIGDYRQALRRVAQRHGVEDPAQLPRLDEVEAAVRERQRLFGGGDRERVLRAQREAAVEAMQFLAGFHPRLVGAVLDGTAEAHTPVQLHLFDDDPDAVSRFLHEHRIPHATGSRRLRHGDGRRETAPLHSFAADGIGFELLVMPRDGLRQAPLDAGGERPVERASLAAVLRLLEGAQGAGGAGG
jgi:hypothetical protein